MRFLSPQKHAKLKKGHLKTGDILITNRGEIGKTALVDAIYDNANLNSQIAWLRCRQGMYNNSCSTL
jgi:type I restriction enzyme S subunit